MEGTVYSLHVSTYEEPLKLDIVYDDFLREWNEMQTMIHQPKFCSGTDDVNPRSASAILNLLATPTRKS